MALNHSGYRSDQRGATRRRCRRVERDVGLVERVAIPQLAGHLLVLLVERLAVVRELAAADLGAAAQRASSGTSRDRRASGAPTRRCRPRRARGSPRPASKSQMPPAATTGVVEAGGAHRARGSSAASGTLRRERAALVGVDRSACTRSRSGRCTDTPPRRPSAASRPRTCRPCEIDRKSRPARASSTPNHAASSTRLPPSITSSPRKRQPTTARSPTRARTAAMTSSGSRTRFSREPP